MEYWKDGELHGNGDVSMKSKRRLGLRVQNWFLELEFSQSNSNLRDRPD